jgi:hypothetical protein
MTMGQTARVSVLVAMTLLGFVRQAHAFCNPDTDPPLACVVNGVDGERVCQANHQYGPCSAGSPPPPSSGTVSGGVAFFQNQGNFCPASRTCTGATYVESQYHTNMPIGETKVFIQRASDNLTIGQGVTDSSGRFTISWTNLVTTGNITANFIWVGEHKDGRFAVRTSSGGQWVFWTPNFTLNAGGNTEIGTWTWGSSGAPNSLANVYDGAFHMWSFGLSQSNRMNAFFTGVSIYAFDDVCPTSCANGPNNRITLDTGAAYSPQGRIMHEMGHIASYKGSRDQSFTQTGNCAFYSYPSMTCVTGSGWNLTSPEWEAAAFEEGVATHLGDVCLYRAFATDPHTCLSDTACGTGSFNIETSLGTTCATDQNRWPLNHVRYHWDNYDSTSDYTGEDLSRGMWEVVDTLNAFPVGIDNRDKDEPFAVQNGSIVIDDLDGRSPIDFRENWISFGTNSSTQLANNCGSLGD